MDDDIRPGFHSSPNAHKHTKTSSPRAGDVPRAKLNAEISELGVLDRAARKRKEKSAATVACASREQSTENSAVCGRASRMRREKKIFVREQGAPDW